MGSGIGRTSSGKSSSSVVWPTALTRKLDLDVNTPLVQTVGFAPSGSTPAAPAAPGLLRKASLPKHQLPVNTPRRTTHGFAAANEAGFIPQPHHAPAPAFSRSGSETVQSAATNESIGSSQTHAPANYVAHNVPAGSTFSRHV